jgi:hypothetical protein
MKNKTLKDIEKYLNDQAELWRLEGNKRPITPEDYNIARGKYYAYTDAWWQVKEFLKEETKNGNN